MPSPPIIGHRKQLLQLEQDLAQGNLTHAYLFAGPAHIGKTTVAQWFAQQILTEGMTQADRDETVRQMDLLIHPDFLVLDQLWMEGRQEDWDVIAQSSNLSQQHREKAGTKTDTIVVDDIRALQYRLVETGTLPRRVCLIRGIERFQPAAANAFLKMLEEPPQGRVFLLTTESKVRVLPTVLSRTRVMLFEQVGNRDMQTLLAASAAEDQTFILHIAQGAPGMALRLSSDADLLRIERLAHTQAAAFWEAHTLHARLKALTPLVQRGGEADRFLFHLGLALRTRPEYRPAQERALTQLLNDVQSNAYRPILIQRFAVEAGG